MRIASDGPAGVALVSSVVPSLVVLDLMLPGLDGLEVCRLIQRERRVPVLMLTARDPEADQEVGLGVGADDYMTKPFSPRELVARVQAIIRRVDEAALAAPAASPLLRIGDLELNADERRVYVGADEVYLTATEFDLLHCLAQRPGTVMSREQLLADVWGYRDGSGARTVDSHVRAIRRKVGNDVIRTVHSVGYAVEVPPANGSAGETVQAGARVED